MAALHIHDLEEERHRTFLAENRKDPVTRELLKAGDRIIICAVCHSAWLVDSWNLNGGKCSCNCPGNSQTLGKIPSTHIHGGRLRTGQPIRVTATDERSNVLFTRTGAVIAAFVSRTVAGFVVLVKIVAVFAAIIFVIGVVANEFSKTNRGVKEIQFKRSEKRFLVHCPYVNLRKSPSPDATLIESISCGTQLDIFGQAPSLKDRRYKWYHIRTPQGKDGWLYAGKSDHYLKTSIPTPANAKVGIVATQTDPLNIRKERDLKSQSLSKAPKGAKIFVLEHTEEWYKVQLYDGTVGYVLGKYIQILP